ncbi:site-specific integrase [Terrisporobacter petrolearius]|uniref:tyrosine-type recombinase/integrase n=1 Tax=Terrisporobacter petrolearius TaxID=1460447 RepID=UPI001D163F67|nr:site-specific integrase [Terrisporobacter petrolearius]MCC3866316.1 site-specific integrase [Terrisporobacter petrolearius]
MANKRQRANGEGSIMKRMVNGKQDGWRASLTIGRNDNGSLKRKDFYGKTKKEVQTKMDDYKKQMSLGLLMNDKITIDQWYFTWLFDFKSKDLAPSTFECYEGVYRLYIKDSDIGDIKLIDLRTAHLQRYYTKLLDIDKLDASNVKRINKTLKTCLKEAIKQGYLQKNWCDDVNLPKVKKEDNIKALSKDDQLRLLEALKGIDLELLITFALGTGLRLGEVLGLKWSDIDFKEHTLSVQRSVRRVVEIQRDGTRERILKEVPPKTENSFRTVPIPKTILNKLKSYKKVQNKLILSLDEGNYQNNNYVFCNNDGTIMDPKKPNRRLSTVLKSNDIELITFHGLRHTYCTRLFEAGVPPKTVQSLVGHSDIETTMNIYTHVMKETKIEAVDKINSIFV